MKNFSVTAIYQETTIEFDVESASMEEALREGEATAKMIFKQAFGDLKSEISIEVWRKF